MARRHGLRAQVARRREQIVEFDRLVAGDARHRRFTRHIAVGEGVDHCFLEAAFVVEDVMGDADPRRDLAGIMDILPGAAGALAMHRGAMVVKLKGDADHVITLLLQQRSRHRAIDAAGHGDHDARVLRTAGAIEGVEHGFYL